MWRQELSRCQEQRSRFLTPAQFLPSHYLKLLYPPRSWYRIQQAALIVIVIVIGAVENTNFVSTTLPGHRSQEYPPQSQQLELVSTHSYRCWRQYERRQHNPYCHGFLVLTAIQTLPTRPHWCWRQYKRRQHTLHSIFDFCRHSLWKRPFFKLRPARIRSVTLKSRPYGLSLPCRRQHHSVQGSLIPKSLPDRRPLQKQSSYADPPSWNDVNWIPSFRNRLNAVIRSRFPQQLTLRGSTSNFYGLFSCFRRRQRPLSLRYGPYNRQNLPTTIWTSSAN